MQTHPPAFKLGSSFLTNLPCLSRTQIFCVQIYPSPTQPATYIIGMLATFGQIYARQRNIPLSNKRNIHNKSPNQRKNPAIIPDQKAPLPDKGPKSKPP